MLLEFPDLLKPLLPLIADGKSLGLDIGGLQSLLDQPIPLSAIPVGHLKALCVFLVEIALRISLSDLLLYLIQQLFTLLRASDRRSLQFFPQGIHLFQPPFVSDSPIHRLIQFLILL